MATSFQLTATLSENPLRVVIQFLCDNKTPFGAPVDPDVYMIMAISSGDGGDATSVLVFPVFTTSVNDKMRTPSLNPSVFVSSN